MLSGKLDSTNAIWLVEQHRCYLVLVITSKAILFQTRLCAGTTPV